MSMEKRVMLSFTIGMGLLFLAGVLAFGQILIAPAEILGPWIVSALLGVLSLSVAMVCIVIDVIRS